MKNIPIMKPTLPDFDEIKGDIEKVFRSGLLTMGPFVKEFEERSANYLGVKHVIPCSSGTSGLIALFSILPAGSKVILPAYTFSATLQGLRWNKLIPIPVDCDDRCNIDPYEVEKALNSSDGISAIVAVHMFGHAPDIESLTNLSKKYQVRLLFDAAHAFGAEYKGRKLGSFGDGEVFSLGPTKTMPTGEGGLITTNDPAVAERMRLFINHGHPAGELDCFFDSLNARLQEINAVVGLHLLPHLDKWIARRNKLADRYDSKLTKLKGISTTSRNSDCISTVKDYAIFINDKISGINRDQVAEKLTALGVMTKKYYWPPVHKLTFVKNDLKNISCPKTELLASQTLSLPLYSHMPEEEIDYVISAIEEIWAEL